MFKSGAGRSRCRIIYYMTGGFILRRYLFLVLNMRYKTCSIQLFLIYYLEKIALLASGKVYQFVGIIDLLFFQYGCVSWIVDLSQQIMVIIWSLFFIRCHRVLFGFMQSFLQKSMRWICDVSVGKVLLSSTDPFCFSDSSHKSYWCKIACWGKIFMGNNVWIFSFLWIFLWIIVISFFIVIYRYKDYFYVVLYRGILIVYALGAAGILELLIFICCREKLFNLIDYIHRFDLIHRFVIILTIIFQCSRNFIDILFFNNSGIIFIYPRGLV